MLKFDKLTLEPQWIDTNLCFCGGGEDPADDMDGPSAATGSQGYSNTGFRGEQSAASPSNQGYRGPTAGMTAEQAQANQNIAENIAAAISANQTVNNPANQAISDQFSVLASAPTSPVSQNVSAVSNAPSVTGLSGFNTGLFNYSIPDVNTNTPAGLSLGTPTSAQDVRAQAMNINSNPLGINIGGFDFTPSGPPRSDFGFTLGRRFARGGAVNQGIGSVFPYPRRR
tara:strand:- start:313 stop:993 length:681 start_codon:yes stop_codon:yes gene_type:complete